MKTRARENPFASDRVEELLCFDPEWLGQTWPELMERLGGLDYRASVVGPHGSGKTTLLSALKTRLEQQGSYVMDFFLNDEKETLSVKEWDRLAGVVENQEVAEGTIVILDGAEQLSWKNWRRFCHLTDYCQGLVITQHRQGKLPLLVKTQTNVEMFRSFVSRLAPGFDIENNIADHAFLSSRGNVREALWQCYDLVATGAPPNFN